ncbi:MAG: hypothetical protein LWW91_03410, partial [Bacteroidales bacterium]|nr:hypothetical protein [Bacteroidales bacterium]
MFRKKIAVTSLTLNEVNANLAKEPDGTMNFNFLFSRDSVRKDSLFFDLSITTLTLRNSRVTYSNLTRERRYVAFNPDRIRFDNINSEISIGMFSRDSLNLTVKSFGGTEQSGLKLENLRFAARGSHKGVTISDFNLRLPETNILLRKINLKAERLQQILAFDPGLQVNIPIDDATIALSDLKAFVPGFAGS